MCEMMEYLSYAVWPLIVALPLSLTSGDRYKQVFPREWYDMAPRDFWYDSPGVWPSSLGLSLGIGAVIVGQFFMLLYFIWFARVRGLKNGKKLVEHKNDDEKSTTVDRKDKTDTYIKDFPAIQKVGARPYVLAEGLMTHLAQPEGFVMLGGYLIGTWMSGLMPASYYSFEGGINWGQVALQLLLQDLIQYGMHGIEHVIKVESTVQLPSLSISYFSGKALEKSEEREPSGYRLTIKWPYNLYANSHKPHHRFTNPRLFDAFNGSPTDTFLMILVPLFLTARLVHCNVWSYMTFGSLYANWLTLIHAEYSHPWDNLFRKFGLGTAADHHVHHKLFHYNYGHTFMYWDRIFGTYKDPCEVMHFNKGV